MMKQNCDVYLFGQVLGTHSFLLKGGFLQPDEYSEIAEQYFLPGGETGTAATVLASLGVNVRMDGTWIGKEVAPMLRAFYEKKPVDLSPLHFTQDDPGVMDYVIIAGAALTVMITILAVTSIRARRDRLKRVAAEKQRIKAELGRTGSFPAVKAGRASRRSPDRANAKKNK